MGDDTVSGDTLPFPGGDFPRPFGVPQRPETMQRMLWWVEQQDHGWFVRSQERYATLALDEGQAHRVCDAMNEIVHERVALAGPESAAEHLRNALMLLEECYHSTDDENRIAIEWGAPKLIDAVRRRVAAALAQLEPGGVEPRRGSTEDR